MNTSESSSGVEHHLAQVRVAGSNPVFRSIWFNAEVVELVDTLDLKSNGQQCPCGFKSRLLYRLKAETICFGFFSPKKRVKLAFKRLRGLKKERSRFTGFFQNDWAESQRSLSALIPADRSCDFDYCNIFNYFNTYIVETEYIV